MSKVTKIACMMLALLLIQGILLATATKDGVQRLFLWAWVAVYGRRMDEGDRQSHSFLC